MSSNLTRHDTPLILGVSRRRCIGWAVLGVHPTTSPSALRPGGLTFPFDGRSFPHTQNHCYINLLVSYILFPLCYATRLIKQDDPQKKKINSCQYFPRAAAEIQDHIDSYRLISECLQPIFSWICDTVSGFSATHFPPNLPILQLKEMLPNKYEVIKLFADVLLAGASSSAFPFGGFVINLNVSTLIHRGEEDLKWCLILIISEVFQGEDLCFFEPGFRISLKHGDGSVSL
jgi:hypothetical protein